MADRPLSAGRRGVLQGGAALGLSFVAPFLIGGCEERTTPADARRRGATYRTLTEAEAHTLETLGEALVPGAHAAGVAHFVDHHLSVPAPESLLMLRYFDVPPPYAPFYKGGLAALDAYARASAGGAFTDLPPKAAERVIRAMFPAPPTGWAGPPAPLVYLVIRSDAVDVVYGTPEGFQKLGIPYMPHIPPQPAW